MDHASFLRTHDVSQSWASANLLENEQNQLLLNSQTSGASQCLLAPSTASAHHQCSVHVWQVAICSPDKPCPAVHVDYSTFRKHASLPAPRPCSFRERVFPGSLSPAEHPSWTSFPGTNSLTSLTLTQHHPSQRAPGTFLHPALDCLTLNTHPHFLPLNLFPSPYPDPNTSRSVSPDIQ